MSANDNNSVTWKWMTGILISLVTALAVIMYSDVKSDLGDLKAKLEDLQRMGFQSELNKERIDKLEDLHRK